METLHTITCSCLITTDQRAHPNQRKFLLPVVSASARAVTATGHGPSESRYLYGVQPCQGTIKLAKHFVLVNAVFTHRGFCDGLPLAGVVGRCPDTKL
jgi:hypothetical protein